MGRRNIIISNNSLNNVHTGKVKIIIFLYYVDQYDEYKKYIDIIPENIDLIIYTSNQEYGQLLSQKVSKKNKKIILTRNHGREISTLLIEAKSEILETDYFCFLHDKKEHADYLKEDVDFWKSNMWGNLLDSSNYVYNVISTFEKNENIGLMVPPEPYGEYLSHWYGNTWFDNYKNTCDLANKLQLKIAVNVEDFCPMGTVFWGRTKAFKSLFEYEWTYEDFPPEPLGQDGTLNHAIERIIKYVVNDSGYEEKTIMNCSYAEKLLERTQDDMRILFSKSVADKHVLNMHHVKEYKDWLQKLNSFCEKYESIYIYGAGQYGINAKDILENNNIEIQGFIVSSIANNPSKIDKYNVYEVNQIEDKNIGIIIGVSYEHRDMVQNTLRSKGLINYFNGL